MVKFERKKTYSKFIALIFFISTSFLGTFIIMNNTDSSFFAPSYRAELIGGQNNPTFFSINKDSFLLWSAIIIVSTLLGFYIGRLIDIKRSEYFVYKIL